MMEFLITYDKGMGSITVTTIHRVVIFAWFPELHFRVTLAPL